MEFLAKVPKHNNNDGSREIIIILALSFLRCVLKIFAITAGMSVCTSYV